jgi:membrane protein
VHLKWLGHDALLLLKRTAQDYSDDHCSKLAAAISYYVLFSIFPLGIFLAGVTGIALQEAQLRADFIDYIVETLPLAEEQARAQLDERFVAIGSGFSIAAALGLGGMLWSASGMMGAIRFALNQAWDTDYNRPLLFAKAIDLVMVLGVGVLLLSSVALTVVLQVARRVNEDVSRWLGIFGAGATFAVELSALLAPLFLSFLTFLLVFRFVPGVRTSIAHIWPGALLSAGLFEALKNGFALYLRTVANYDALYGSLGAVIAFLFFVFLSASILLLGAEMAAEFPRVIHGRYDEAEDTVEDAVNRPEPARGGAVLRFLRRLVASDRPRPRAVSDADRARDRRLRIRAEIAERVERAQRG